MQNELFQTTFPRLVIRTIAKTVLEEVNFKHFHFDKLELHYNFSPE